MKIPLTLLKSMDRDGSYKESDLLFKIALDMSELEPSNSSDSGSFGAYYGDKNKIQQTLQQMGVKHSNPGIKKIFDTYRSSNVIQETLGMNIIAPLINQKTQLVAPMVPNQSIASVLSTGVLATQHFDGITGLDFLDSFNTDYFKERFSKEVVQKIVLFIKRELRKVGITHMDMHHNNFIIKSRLFTELKTICYDIIHKSKTNSINIHTLIEEMLPKINLNKRICVFDFGDMMINRNSPCGNALVDFKKTLERYKESYYSMMISKEIDHILRMEL